ncbi:MAG: SHOCT domain-containing protein [Thermincola sp.]|nr:SHOCT domain-containing protein [Thermincola sp.]MDT3704451.1 SHOCT domain-containing protein [Thermincola sp.]
MMYGYGYGMGLWMIIGWIVSAAVIVFAVYGLFMLLRRSDTRIPEVKSRNPLDILKERLAKGDITTEEYQTIREELLK